MQNQKITPENSPAATQLFTPHWFVRDLVDNSLGRLWLLNRPTSKLAEQMAYYIPPEKPEAAFLRINGPQDIKVCDPTRSEEHTSELQSLMRISYAVFCLKKKTIIKTRYQRSTTLQ